MRALAPLCLLLVVGCPGPVDVVDVDDGGVLDGGVPPDGGVADPVPDECGDLIVGASEACDDGNERNGDGCSAACRRELCASGGSVLDSTARVRFSRNVESFAIADFNGDGHNDVVSVSSEVLGLSVSRAGGGFTESVVHSNSLGESVAAVDLDDDGDPDIVLADEDRGVLGFLNTGGTFAAEPSFTVAGVGAEQLAVADVDADGRSDLIVAHHGTFASAGVRSTDGGILVLFADAPLVFSSREFPVGVDPESFATADFDGDGDLDIASANESSDDVVVLINAGGRSLVRGAVVPAGTHPESIVAEDLDEDGDADLAVVAGGQVVLLENDGAATFTLHLAIATVVGTRSIIAADVDGDGLVDLASANGFDVASAGGVSVFRRTGPFAFAPRLSLQLVESDGRSGFAVALAVGDLDGDCQTDLLVGVKSGRAIALSTACGNAVTDFNEACDDGNDVDGDGCDANCRISACGNEITAGDEVCDDGNLDNGDTCDSNCTPPACGNGVAFNEVCDDGNLVDGDGCDANCTPTGCGNGATVAPEQCDDANVNDNDGCDSNCRPTGCGNGIRTTGELCDDGNVTNGDGCDSDCRASTCANGVLDPGEVCFGRVDVIANSDGHFGRALVADINDDGFDDLLVIEAASVAIFVADGVGDFTARPPLSLVSLGAPRTLAVADMDRDGDLDLIASLSTSKQKMLTIFANNGVGIFGTGTTTVLNNAGGLGFVVAEFDTAAGPDVVVIDGSSNLVFYGNDGAGGLETPRTTVLGIGCLGLIAADVDSDLDTDIVAACASSLIGVLNDGTGVFSVDTDTASTVQGVQFDAADLDDDGDLDVVGYGFLVGAQLFRGDDAGNFVSAPIAGAPNSAENGLALGDLDGDGVLDLAIGTRDTVRFLLGSGTGDFTVVGDLIVPDIQPRQIEFADLDGDGALELLSIEPGRIDVRRPTP